VLSGFSDQRLEWFVNALFCVNSLENLEMYRVTGSVERILEASQVALMWSCRWIFWIISHRTPLFTIGVCRSRQVSVCSDPWTHRFAFIRPRCAAQSEVSSGFSKRRRSTAASRRCEVFVGHFEYRFGRDVPHLYRVQWTSGGRWSCQINYLPKHNHSYLRICVWNLESSTIRGFDWRE